MIRQASIIFGCLAVGEIFVYATKIPFPSSLIGMLILVVLLKLGWIKLHWVKGFADLLVQNLAFFFVPAGVAVMLYFDLIKASFWPIVISVLVSTVITLIATGWFYEVFRKYFKKRTLKRGGAQ